MFIAECLKQEGVTRVFGQCGHTNYALIDACHRLGIEYVSFRHEQQAVHAADAYFRVSHKLAVINVHLSPGLTNALTGVATAAADCTPMVVIAGNTPSYHHAKEPHQGIRFHADASQGDIYRPICKRVWRVDDPALLPDVMPRALNVSQTGRPGAVLLDVPMDVFSAQVNAEPVTIARRPGYGRCVGPDDGIAEAAHLLSTATRPVIFAGNGVTLSDASDELKELAELGGIPVATTLMAKGVFPEDHPLALGSGGPVVTGHALECLRGADLVFGIGCSFTRHGMAASIPAGKTLIHATNDERDLNKSYAADYPLLGDARLVLRQFIEAVKSEGGRPAGREGVRAELERVRSAWLREWAPVLGSDAVPISPYRVIAEFMRAVDPRDAIVTHDSGSPRDQLLPFYRAVSPRSYLGWGKSHALGTGLGLTIGAKLAAPDKLCVNFMGDAAFGMTGLDFETAVRCGIPILTVVLNNSSLAIEIPHLVVSHDRYRTREIGGRYADLGRAMGGWAERVERPEEVAGAFGRARKATESGQAALLEFITSEETRFSHRGALR